MVLQLTDCIDVLKVLCSTIVVSKLFKVNSHQKRKWVLGILTMNLRSWRHSGYIQDYEIGLFWTNEQIRTAKKEDKVLEFSTSEKLCKSRSY
jgi:hypothetical protein